MARNLITIAPGVFIDPLQRTELDPQDQYVLLDAHGLRRLGLSASQEKLLLRLDYAGLIKLHQITPRRRLLNLSTWQQHLRNVDEDPDYWKKTDTLRRWRMACMSV
jgi:hypothetical protein